MRRSCHGRRAAGGQTVTGWRPWTGAERVQQQPPDAAALEAVGDGDRDLGRAGLVGHGDPAGERVVDAVAEFVAPAR